jgi:hypothetical protein
MGVVLRRRETSRLLLQTIVTNGIGRRNRRFDVSRLDEIELLVTL